MRSRIDTLIGRVTMYNLLIIVLAVIAVVAVIASVAGQLFYTPAALALSLVVAVLATVGSSWLAAWIFRTRAHLPSAVISGLLIFFVFLPSATLPGLGFIALAGVIASASKYVLAIRGRHVLNPVAVAAVVLSVTALYPSGWWVATPVLLPFVAVGALLVLYRTRKLAMGLVFVVVAAGVVIVRVTAGGLELGESVQLAFASFPIVFLAGFMLSEPLTLPPRRLQQLLVAAVVAVLFAIPFQLGPIYSSPEIALVIGNIVAFAFGQRRSIRMRYLGVRDLTPTAVAFDFEPASPVRFRPGQYLELGLPHGRSDSRGSRRAFSIASAPGADVLSLGVKLSQPSSSFKRALVALEPGATVRATWVGGDFLLPADPATPVILAAGGIGITPFISQLQSAARVPAAAGARGGHGAGSAGGRAPVGGASSRGSGGSAGSRDTGGSADSGGTGGSAGSGAIRDAVLVYSVSSADELAYLPELVASGIRVLVTAPQPPADLPPNWRYLGAGRLSPDVLAGAVPDLSSRRGYVSGPPGYVDHVSTVLRRAGAHSIRTDQFAGY
ncbi:ferredoxin--NADP reductase [Herbiconiux solani]|uniref:ferredoxin--NADP reductase n=1 Tax=Herbiconiux solani TaxID=661329 RepID=UPI00082408EA|nr:FAD-dependent oxidoreductase [Herbiconiux solani]